MAQPTVAETSDNTLAEYRYDALGRRIAKRLGTDAEDPDVSYGYYYSGLGLRSLGKAGWRVISTEPRPRASGAGASGEISPRTFFACSRQPRRDSRSTRLRLAQGRLSTRCARSQ